MTVAETDPKPSLLCPALDSIFQRSPFWWMHFLLPNVYSKMIDSRQELCFEACLLKQALLKRLVSGCTYVLSNQRFPTRLPTRPSRPRVCHEPYSSWSVRVCLARELRIFVMFQTRFRLLSPNATVSGSRTWAYVPWLDSQDDFRVTGYDETCR